MLTSSNAEAVVFSLELASWKSQCPATRKTIFEMISSIRFVLDYHGVQRGTLMYGS